MIENKNSSLQKEIADKVSKKKSELYEALINEAIDYTSKEINGVLKILIYDLVREEFLKDISVSSALKEKVKEIYKGISVFSNDNVLRMQSNHFNESDDSSVSDETTEDMLPDNIEEVDLEKFSEENPDDINEDDKKNSDSVSEEKLKDLVKEENKKENIVEKQSEEEIKKEKKLNKVKKELKTNKEIEAAERQSPTGILNADEGYPFEVVTKSIMDSKISKYTEDASFDINENKIAFKSKEVYTNLGGTRFTWEFVRKELINDDPAYLQDESTLKKLLSSDSEQLDKFFEASFKYLYDNYKVTPEFKEDFKDKTDAEIQSYLKEKRFFAKNLVSVALRTETEIVKMPEDDMKKLDKEFLILFLRLVKVGRKFREVFEMMRYVYCQTVYHYILQKNENYKEETDKILNYANNVPIDDVIERIRNTDIYFVNQIYFCNL